MHYRCCSDFVNVSIVGMKTTGVEIATLDQKDIGLGHRNTSETEEGGRSLVLQTVLIVILFVSGLLGGLVPKSLSALPEQWVQLCNAFAGGLIIGVAMCHMIAESSEGVEPWGRWIAYIFANSACKPEHEHEEAAGKSTNSTNLGGRLHGGEEGQCEPYPLGLALATLGFFFMVGLEELLLHDTKRTQSALAGCGTFIGIIIHSTLEGLAIGGVGDPIVMVVVAARKFFAFFAASSTLLSCYVALWALAVVVLALSGPIAAVIGSMVSKQLGERVFSAALQCFAAGMLLGVGINNLLLPSLHTSHVWHHRKVCAAILGALTMMVLAIWS